MNGIEYVLLEAQRSLHCTVCGRHYSIDEIKLRGFLDNTYILQTICDNGHLPLVTISLFSVKGKSKFSPHYKPIVQERIIADDVLDAQKQINEFDGNFEKLFKK